MLKQLDISNYAIIEQVSIPFDQGLTVITGETGAGKSIILGALGLILGNRADSSVLNNPESKSVVEASFEISSYNLQSLFEEEDIDYEENTVIRREITPAGKSRAFINDTPVKLSLLKVVTDRLVNLHQQFDLLDIQKKSFQLNMLDAYAGVVDSINHYQAEYKQLTKKEKQLSKLVLQSQQMANESDFLQFQLKELVAINLEEINQEDLEDELKVLNNAEGIKNAGSHGAYAISEDQNCVIDQLRLISKELSPYCPMDKTIDRIYIQLEEQIEALNDLSSQLKNHTENIDNDGNRANEINEVLNDLYRLQKKHQVQTTAELVSLQQEIEDKLLVKSNVQQEIDSIQVEISQLKKSLTDQAKSISSNRAKSIPSYESKISDLLADLGMPKAKLVVQQDITTELSKTGLDDIEYYFAPNPGSKPKSLKDTASGGEISRLTLCLKSVVADIISLPTLIFDEIDTGVSGAISLKMGNIMRDMARGRQVISITHSAQIASRAEEHLFIYKKIKSKKTKTQIRSLDQEERVIEMAKILSGDPPSQSAISNAKELMKM